MADDECYPVADLALLNALAADGPLTGAEGSGLANRIDESTGRWLV
jgi:hypothetical protein